MFGGLEGKGIPNSSQKYHKFKIISKKADGSMRDGLSILDQMICFCDNELEVNKVKDALGVIDNQKYIEIFNSIGEKQTKNILFLLDDILNSGISIIDFIEGFNAFIRDELILFSNNKNNQLVKSNFYNELDLIRILEVCLKFRINLKNNFFQYIYNYFNY